MNMAPVSKYYIVVMLKITQGYSTRAVGRQKITQYAAQVLNNGLVGLL